MNEQLLLLQESAPEGGGISQQLIMFGLIGIVFYFFMIRPQIKRTKEAKKFREGITIGDKIVTIGGIHGKVVNIEETTMVISTEGTKMKIEKSAVSANTQDQLGAQQR